MAGLSGVQFIQELDAEFGARASQWMAQGNGAAMDIHHGGIQVQFARHCNTLAGERLVQFVQVDVGGGQPSLLKGLGDGMHRAHAHDPRLEAADVVGFEPCNGFHPKFLEHAFTHHHHKGRAI